MTKNDNENTHSRNFSLLDHNESVLGIEYLDELLSNCKKREEEIES